MQVKATVSFVGRVNGQKFIVRAGEVVELPAGADWLGAGLVVAVEAEPALTTETGTTTKRKRAKKDA